MPPDQMRIHRAGAYFGADMAAAQGDVERKAYLALLVQFLAVESRMTQVNVLEVGSWAGASTVTWARTMKDLHLTGRVLCVDFWQPYFDLRINQAEVYQQMTAAARDGRILDLFLNNLRACHVDDIVDYIVGDSKTILPQLSPGSFQIVFLDASHTYADILADITTAKDLVSDGGIICGDDFELSRDQVDSKSHQAALATGVDYIEDPKAATSYHPGVTEAVAVSFDTVSCWNGVWALRKLNDKWEPIDLSGFSPAIPEHLTPYSGSDSQPKIVESYKNYNFVQWQGQIYALQESLGPVDVKLGSARLWRDFTKEEVIVVSDADLARARVDAVFAEARIYALQEQIAALNDEFRKQLPVVATPELVGSHAGMNFVALGRGFIAIRQSLGPVNMQAGPEALISQFGNENVIAGNSIAELQNRLDVLGLQKDMTELVGRVTTTIDHLEQLLGDHREMSRRTELLDQQVDQLESAGERHAAEVAVQSARIDQLGELVATLNDATVALQQHDDQLTQSIDQLTWKVAEPSAIGSHGGFDLIAYDGKIFGVPHGLGFVDVRVGATELAMRYGPDAIIVARTPDGIRARIDLMAVEKRLERIRRSRAGRLLGWAT